MYLRSIYLHHFRCYSKSIFEFGTGLNSIQGPNARGKTTLLEAIYLLIAGQSFRTSQLSDLIQVDKSEFFLEAVFEKNGIEQCLKVVNGKERKIIYNNTSYTSFAHLLGLLQGVVITPDDVALIKGGPNLRRHFLDLQSAQIDPLYVHHMVRYNRCLRHRNIQLRNRKIDNIHLWENEMAASAAYLIQHRQKAVKELCGQCGPIYQRLSGEEAILTVSYKSNAEGISDQILLKNYFLEQYGRLRQKECLIGYTLIGPHKDDLIISIGNKEARFFASEGQQRSGVTALHFAVWKRLQALSGINPLLLIDDLGISLDSNRRQRLIEFLGELGQVFLTTTHPISIPSKNISL